MESIGKSRRDFLVSVVSGIVGLLLLKQYLSPMIRKKPGNLTLAKADIPEQGALVYQQARIAIVREKGELYALDLVCTHLGCTVSVTPTELVCPCHGSRFDRRGIVLEGPADRPLKRYAVQVGGNSIIVLLT